MCGDEHRHLIEPEEIVEERTRQSGKFIVGRGQEALGRDHRVRELGAEQPLARVRAERQGSQCSNRLVAAPDDPVPAPGGQGGRHGRVVLVGNETVRVTQPRILVGDRADHPQQRVYDRGLLLRHAHQVGVAAQERKDP